MTRFVKRILPIQPESPYDHRLQLYLQDAMGDVERKFSELDLLESGISVALGLTAPVVNIQDGNVSIAGNITASRADPAQESSFVAVHQGATAQIAMLSRSTTAGTYGVFGPNTAGFYANTAMRFLADSGNSFLWGWPNEALGLRKTTPGGVDSANLQIGTQLPNLYMFGDPQFGSGLRIHYSDVDSVAVIDTSADLIIRDGSGAEIFTFSPSRKTVKYAVRSSDPASPANGEMWYLNGTGFRRRANGVTATF